MPRIVFGKNQNVRTSTFYRPDLHNELKRIALLQSNGFKCPTICLGSRVATVNIETATVYLEDGTRLKADLLIGADGERSVVKAAFSDPETLRMAPYRIFRAIIPTEELLSNDKSKALLTLTKGSFAMFPHGDRTLSWFEGRDGLLQDLDLGYLLRPGDEPRGERDPSRAREKMLERFRDFHPDIVDVLRKTDMVADYEVYFNKPLLHLFKGKAVLIGDAAHSMFPTTGQGGSQSMEDAGALGSILSHLPSSSSLPERLRIFGKLRKERTATVQMLSGLIFGQEEGWVRRRPEHFIQRTGVRSGEDHLELLYK
ncbi:Aurachin C monooxygenase/isomerase [Lachnellula subtilissima]|uniref:Aurachin C monooxygenase/isomerase n=1 Tax=Lachnellula subtilissima TaxID=602034 RepID=A0A8H8RYL7_9HELO|nr:Aurachin C monooxygenase/isomerase [Lachnellula subtilissima]